MMSGAGHQVTLNASVQYVPGIFAEEEYYKLNKGLPNSYNHTFERCLPCPEACESLLCLSRPSCSMVPDIALRLPLLVATAMTMLGVIVLFILTCKYRGNKVMRASCPGLLYLTLWGTLLLYFEVVVAGLVASDVTCMLRPWVRHLGFALTYGGLQFKMWRISVIMRVFKPRIFRTKDSHLYRKLGLFIFIWCLYLFIWSVSDPVRALEYDSQTLNICQLKPWNFVAISGEFVFLLWGAFLCYQARKAPDLYNETRPISYAIWNEAVWEIAMVTARLLLHKYPDSAILFVIRFLRTQITVTALLLLLYTPKFMLIFGSIREVHGTLTDVYGQRRVHRLSLMVNKHGDVKTIYCVPCGPLVCGEPSDAETSVTHENKQCAKENEYTKAEVDALIEMVSKLKSEKELYKTQTKRLLQILRSTKRKTVNGLSPTLVAEDPSDSEPIFDYRINRDNAARGDANLVSDGDEGQLEVREADFEGGGGQRSSRASTCTTYVSSASDECSTVNADCPHEPCNGEPLNGRKQPCQLCALKTNGISQYAFNVIRRKLANNHVLGKDVSPETEDFPRLVHSHEARCHHNRLTVPDYLPVVSTVYGDVCDTNIDAHTVREMQEMSGAVGKIPRVGTSSSSPDHSQTPMIPTSNAEKLNFIMYI